MSLLKDKHVLMVGDEHPVLLNLKQILKREGVTLFDAPCSAASLADIESLRIDILVLNHLTDDVECPNFLKLLNEQRTTKALPVFALVHNTEAAIKAVLMEGAADYFTPEEKTDSMLAKVKSLFGQPDTFSGSNVFALPNDETTVRLAGKRLFVFEDDPFLQNLLTAKLELNGVTPTFAPDGLDAVTKIKAVRPQVIVLDLMMPKKDGFAVLAEIKADPELKKIPIIVFSNSDSDEDKKRVFALGADRFFVKVMTELSTLIESIEDLAP